MPQNHFSFSTERLFLRPTTEDDPDFIIELLNCPSYLRFIGDRNIHSHKEAIEYIQLRVLPQLDQRGYSNFTVIRTEDQKKIGTCGLYHREGMDEVDIGFAYLPEYEGKGYAFEAASELLVFAKSNFNLNQVSAYTTTDNESCQRLLKKLGFTVFSTRILPGEDEPLLWFQKTLVDCL